jgi:hypothetical protein
MAKILYMTHVRAACHAPMRVCMTGFEFAVWPKRKVVHFQMPRING